MADAGFDFRPVSRHEAKRFEPPPWEQDQFEELARKRAEAEVQADADAAAEVLTEDRTAPALEQQAVSGSAAAIEGEPDAAARQQEALVPSAAAEGDRLDEARVTEMLAQLASEEPPAAKAFWKTSVVVGTGMVVFGAVFLIWGVAAVVAARKTGAVGMFGGSVLMLFGAGFVFGGLYVVVKNLRQQGVL